MNALEYIQLRIAGALTGLRHPVPESAALARAAELEMSEYAWWGWCRWECCGSTADRPFIVCVATCPLCGGKMQKC